MRETAESLLHKLQQALGDVSGDEIVSDRETLREVERLHGPQVTRYGRLLNDLLAGSSAWDLFEKPGRARLPPIHELCVCEPVVAAMRESGELAEREHLLRRRDKALTAAWRLEAATEEQRWAETQDVHNEYSAAIEKTTENYRAHYNALRKAGAKVAAPLTGLRLRSRPFLQPPLIALLFRACHQEGRRFSQGGNIIQVLPAGEAILDALVWDVAALAVSAFFVRTDGRRGDATFPFLLDDYFQWRGVDPRKRSPEMRRQIAMRLELLCGDQMPIRSETMLWRTDPATGQRKKTPALAEGPFLVKHARFLHPRPRAGVPVAEPRGFLVSLGAWAGPLVEERAMFGVHLRCLAEYDLQRQQWERRIGWYLVFQMNNQASKMTFQEVVQDSKARTLVTPQHPLKMRTVLMGSQIAWEEAARTNPGKVIKQWCDALETLQQDGLLGPSPCLDGLADGSDLPLRGRLAAMLERRYQFVPGKALLPHLRAKQSAAARKRAG